MDQAEVAIIKAAFAVISTDAGLLALFPTMRLTEGLTQLLSFGVGTLVVAGFPVLPKDYPSQREIVLVDIVICPVMAFEETTVDSTLAINTLFNQVRKLLNANLPLVDPATPGRSVCDAVLGLDWRRTLYPAIGGVRIPNFFARYQASIDVKTGDFA